MKKNLLISSFLFLSFSMPVFAQRYLSEIFTGTTVTSNVIYGKNYSTLLSPLSLFMDTLKADVYQPVGDNATAHRATVIVMHAGSVLPIFYNYECTGLKTDSAVAEMCRRFARRGYTAIAMDYRLGWNPFSTDQDTRTGSILQAVGRAVQDAKACVRFFRNNALTSNDYHIDPNMIILGGLNTGGYCALSYPTIHNNADLSILPLLSTTTNSTYCLSPGVSYFDSTCWGNIDGYGGNPAKNFSGNTPGVSNAIQFSFGLGGAIPAISWLKQGDVPMVCFHSKNDPGAPYAFGPVYNGATGAFVINAYGSYSIIHKADSLQNNIAFQNNSWTDVYTTVANQRNGGSINDGLFPFTPSFAEAAPWEWWDSTTCFQIMTAPTSVGGLGFTMGHADTVWFNSLSDHPEMVNGAMAKALANAYIDTIMGYLNPRIFQVIMGVPDLAKMEASISVYPNPADGFCNVHISDASNPIRNIRMYDLTGRLIYSDQKINRQTYTMDTKSYRAGMYLLKIGLEKGEVVKKLTIQ
jgi:hypothetical protein